MYLLRVLKFLVWYDIYHMYLTTSSCSLLTSWFLSHGHVMLGFDQVSDQWLGEDRNWQRKESKLFKGF